MISASGGDITAEGGGGNDRIRTGDGEDHVSGGPGQDSIATGRGNDRIEALDGQRDRVNCGRGKRDVGDRRPVRHRHRLRAAGAHRSLIG